MTNNFNFNSPLNVSLNRYIEVDKLLQYIDFSNCNSFTDANISDGLLYNYTINIGFSKNTVLFGFNKYINNFWKYYLTDSNKLFDTVYNFYKLHSKKDEYYPFFLMKKIPCIEDFDYAVHYLLFNCYLLDTSYLFNGKSVLPQQPFNINELAYKFNIFYTKTFVYKEFDKFKKNKQSVYAHFEKRFIYSNLGNQSVLRYYKYYRKFGIYNRYKVLLQTKEICDIIKWKRIEFINGYYLYSNYF